MLRVTLELEGVWRRTLGVVEIRNDGTGTRAQGNYAIQLYAADGEGLAEARVEHHERRLGAWTLVQRALGALALPQALDVLPRLKSGGS